MFRFPDLCITMRRLTVFIMTFAVLFTTNVSIWDKDSRWLTKELGGIAYLEVSAHNSELSLHSSKCKAVEHELLHAASHMPLFLIEEFSLHNEPHGRSIQHSGYVLRALSSSLPPPFRPPRVLFI